MSLFNCRRTLTESLRSIFSQIGSDTEVVVVDNQSTDGSGEILEGLSAEGKIKLVVEKCSWGGGRQRALETSSGEYIISGLDMDDTFHRRLRPLLRFYHEKTEGSLLSGFGEATMVAPRALLTRLGGWRDLQFRENWELCRRAAKVSSFRWTIFPLVRTTNPHGERRRLWSRTRYRYIRYRENLRVGHKQFEQSERTGLGQKAVWLAARASLPFLKDYRDDFPFTAVDPRLFVDSSEYWDGAEGIERERELYQIGLHREVPARSNQRGRQTWAAKT